MNHSFTRGLDLPRGVTRPLVENCSDERNRVNSEFDPNILPNGYQDYLTLEVGSSGGFIANTGPYVGIIPCEDGSFLPIRPKTEISNLTYFLRKSGKVAHDLDSPFEEDVPYQTVFDDLVGMHEFYIRQFLEQLDSIKRHGLLKKRTVETIISERVEGRIDVEEYTKNVYRGELREIPQERTSQTVDNLPNKFLKFTLQRLANSRFSDIDQGDIVHRLDYFRPVKSLDQSKDFDSLKQAIRRLVEERDLPPSRSYYIPALESALLIIEQGDITFTEEVDQEFRSFMFNMHDRFEDYIRNIVGEYLGGRDYDVYNGEKSAHSIGLYDSQSYGSLTLEPDIIVSQGTDNIGIIDVKYKEELKNVDHYQLWTYKRQYEVDFAAFISIPESASQESTKEVYNRDGTEETISNFRFWMGDFTSSEDSLGRFLDGLIDS